MDCERHSQQRITKRERGGMDVDVRVVKRGIRHTQMCWQGGVCVNLEGDDVMPVCQIW